MTKFNAKKDIDIRSDLVAWLLATHQEDPNVRLCHEFKIRSQCARADVVLLNGEMAGFEIKSDSDTVVRLSRQISAFSVVMDKVVVVAAEKNIEKVIKIAPEWCGVVFYKKDTEERFQVISLPRQSPLQESYEIARLLSASEIYLALKRRGMSRGLSNSRASEVLNAFSSRLMIEEQRADVLSALKERVDFSEEMKVKYNR